MGSASVWHSVLNVKAAEAAFNEEKALVGAFSVIVQLQRLIVYSTSNVTTLSAMAAPCTTGAKG